MKTRIVVQLLELAEFADLLGLPPDSNEVVFRWVKQGHAAKFSDQYDKVADEVEAKCHQLCEGRGCRNLDRCPLRFDLHRIMKDNGNW
jgi:hypothetical protein